MNYSQPSKEFSEEFFKMVRKAERVIITSHIQADEDSVASVLSVYRIITDRYPEKNIRIIYSGLAEEKYRSFRSYQKIEYVPDMAEVLVGSELLIVLDGSQFSRFSKQPEKLKSTSQTICIDHHSSPIDQFTLSLVSPTSSSCTEIIYLALCQDVKVDKELAEIFMLGILGDTGNFNYLKPYQTETLSVAKKLIEIGNIEIQEFQSRYSAISKRVFDIVKELTANTSYSSADGWPDFQYSFVDREFMVSGKYSDNEISEASHIYTSNYLRMISGYTWGFVITPKENGNCGISCRSLPKSVGVRDMLERMKIGGGHDRAAGGTFKKKADDVKVEDCIAAVESWIKDNSPTII